MLPVPPLGYDTHSSFRPRSPSPTRNSFLKIANDTVVAAANDDSDGGNTAQRNIW